MCSTCENYTRDELFRVYFLVTSEDETKVYELHEELRAEEEVLEIFAQCAASKRMWNEGHCEEGLVCYFHVRGDQIANVQETLLKNRGGGDDMIFLACGLVARDFRVVWQPGLESGRMLTDIDFSDEE